MDKEALKNRAVEIGSNLNLEGFNDEEIGALSLFRAVMESIGSDYEGLKTGVYPQEAVLVHEITSSKPFRTAFSRIPGSFLSRAEE